MKDTNLKKSEEKKLKFKSNLIEHLKNQKSDLLNRTSQFKLENFGSRGPVAEEAEQISQEITEILSISLHERDRLALHQIEISLAKLEAGTYGDCESCGVQISEKRLLARPFASLCIECQEESESNRSTN